MTFWEIGCTYPCKYNSDMGVLESREGTLCPVDLGTRVYLVYSRPRREHNLHINSQDMDVYSQNISICT